MKLGISKDSKMAIYILKEKILAKTGKVLYNAICCGMIAMKREVAAPMQGAGFPWSECQVRKLATSHCTIFIFRMHRKVC